MKIHETVSITVDVAKFAREPMYLGADITWDVDLEHITVIKLRDEKSCAALIQAWQRIPNFIVDLCEATGRRFTDEEDWWET